MTSVDRPEVDGKKFGLFMKTYISRIADYCQTMSNDADTGFTNSRRVQFLYRDVIEEITKIMRNSHVYPPI